MEEMGCVPRMGLAIGWKNRGGAVQSMKMGAVVRRSGGRVRVIKGWYGVNKLTDPFSLQMRSPYDATPDASRYTTARRADL